ncbi:MAG: UDP-N-acetylmuramoyl-L-alanyl-D-glutamate--2,6-diaminopimelate ligase [Alphaproteobacteria bacterium]|nr:UDP-N-acetylmuramoyl-L-alanyl-D-glutamate--2,6-diaminopimelate ligase [Alphaproteobacteria bacterium SS10]
MTGIADQIATPPTPSDGGQISVENATGLPDQLSITGVTSDSRRVTPGGLFCAIPGHITDGRNFIGQAVEKGAAAILAPTGTDWPSLNDSVRALEAKEPRRVLALAAAAFYGRQPNHIAAVTGTSGKTSTALFTQQLLEIAGHRTASLGTLGLRADGFPETEALTTPAPEDLHDLLAKLADHGFDHCAMEASSHGLDQYRLDGVKVQAAGFTNLGRDHLDYHADADEYFAAKARLFSELLIDGGTMVINADDERFPELKTIAAERGLRVVDYGYAAETLKLVEAIPHTTSIALTISAAGETHQVDVPLVGTFQAHNVLCAIGLRLALRGELDDPRAISESIADSSRLVGAPGRMDHVTTHKSGAPVFVDYAHKPDALKAVLHALRPHTENRLVVVFGCGGDRDQGKRPEMGRIAADLADRVIVTDDNPRGEDPAFVRSQIMAACPEATEIGDRREAIAAAIEGLEPGDVLVIAGKGHETGQKIGDRVLPFDDTTTAQELIGEPKS